jgi:hypothetical protein
MKVFLFNAHPNLEFDTAKNQFVVRLFGTTDLVTKFDMIRFLKTKYTNRERFVSGFIDPIFELLVDSQDNSELDVLRSMLEFFLDEYDNVTAFTYQQAFAIRSEAFKAIIFGSIRVPEMIKALGHSRIATAGQAVKHKQYSKQGDFLGYREYDVVFETHVVNGKALGLRGNVYAVKCWCTSTDNEHWLWIEDQYKDDPLEAIARTFHIHENLVPFIKELKRQGDILLVELTEDIEPRGNMVSLSKDQYFGLLTAQS